MSHFSTVLNMSHFISDLKDVQSKRGRSKRCWVSLKDVGLKDVVVPKKPSGKSLVITASFLISP